MKRLGFGIIILAAGKGKRMKNPDLPKVLAEVSGRPLIRYVVKKSENLHPDKLVVVVGHHKQKVIDFIRSMGYSNVDYAEQDEQLGTGHAVMQAKPFFDDFNGNILILLGDVPLLRSETIMKLLGNHERYKSDLSVLTAKARDPEGYGRIVRDENREFVKIVEEKDASEEEKKIKEINGGIFYGDAKLLFDSLEQVSNKNAQGEYYLTDIIEIAIEKGKKVNAFMDAEFDELQGVNTPGDLSKVQINYMKYYGLRS